MNKRETVQNTKRNTLTLTLKLSLYTDGIKFRGTELWKVYIKVYSQSLTKRFMSKTDTTMQKKRTTKAVNPGIGTSGAPFRSLTCSLASTIIEP